MARSSEKKELKNDSKNVHDSKGKFAKGNPGGGRPKGSKDTRAIFIEVITPEAAAKILDIFLKKCEEGDIACILFAMKRLYPEGTAPRFTSIKLPGKEALETIRGVQNVSADVLLDVAEGIVSIDDATGFLNLLDKHQNINMGVINDQVDRFEEIKKAQGIANL